MSAEMMAPQQAAIQQAEPSIGSTIQWAMQNGATVEQMRELYAFQREVKADQAREAFHRAFAAFKAEAIVVLRNVDIKDGPLKGKKHADLYGAVSVAMPYLSKHNLSHRWKITRDEPGWIEITCIVTHIQGHSEDFPMGGAPDKGPGRNDIQARASTVSYLERYTFMGVCGLAVKGMDDDGNGGDKDKPRMSVEDFDTRINLICEAASVSDLEKVYIPANRAAVALDDKEAARSFTNAKNKRYRELMPKDGDR